jgi:hypothetical protein
MVRRHFCDSMVEHINDTKSDSQQTMNNTAVHRSAPSRTLQYPSPLHRNRLLQHFVLAPSILLPPLPCATTTTSSFKVSQARQHRGSSRGHPVRARAARALSRSIRLRSRVYPTTVRPCPQERRRTLACSPLFHHHHHFLQHIHRDLDFSLCHSPHHPSACRYRGYQRAKHLHQLMNLRKMS